MPERAHHVAVAALQDQLLAARREVLRAHDETQVLARELAARAVQMVADRGDEVADAEEHAVRDVREHEPAKADAQPLEWTPQEALEAILSLLHSSSCLSDFL